MTSVFSKICLLIRSVPGRLTRGKVKRLNSSIVAITAKNIRPLSPTRKKYCWRQQDKKQVIDNRPGLFYFLANEIAV